MSRELRSGKPQLLWVEFNEFDPEYLAKMAAGLGLKHLQQVFALRHSTTSTSDNVEHQGLDPWVQWVGIHSGVPTFVHGVRRLGATRGQTRPQIWHMLARNGFSWGVWGAMNAPLGDPQGCRFFMPDPWSFDESAYPDYLNDLLALPRYISKNYLDIDYKMVSLACLRLVRFFAPPDHWGILARLTGQLLKSITATGANVHTLTTLFDYFSVLLVTRLRRKLNPDFTLIFLNHVAHLQHQFWRPGSTPHPEMRFGLEMSNLMLGMLLDGRREGEGFLLMNGLKQKNVAGNGLYVYRQKNPQEAVEALGVTGGKVEQCMTNDANILFSTREDADRGFALLEGCKLSDGHTTFFVERPDFNRVFYQCAFEHNVRSDTLVVGLNGCSLRFYDLFELVTERTGAHISEGDAFGDGIDLPEIFQNHEAFHHVARHFGVRTTP